MEWKYGAHVIKIDDRGQFYAEVGGRRIWGGALDTVKKKLDETAEFTPFEIIDDCGYAKNATLTVVGIKRGEFLVDTGHGITERGRVLKVEHLDAFKAYLAKRKHANDEAERLRQIANDAHDALPWITTDSL